MARSAVGGPRGLISCGSIRREPDHFKRSFLRGPRMKFEPTHVGCYGSKEGDRWRGRRWRLLEVPYPAEASGVGRITSNGRVCAGREGSWSRSTSAATERRGASGGLVGGGGSSRSHVRR